MTTGTRISGGVLVRERRRGASTALLCAALVVVGPTLPFGVGEFVGERPAEAMMDPMRVITSQIVRPNILILLDTSGSMAERPDVENFPSAIVGGDCYQGQNCTAAVFADLCPDGVTACDPVNTCTDGTSCVAGDKKYCDNGAGCINERTCGTSAANKTVCPDATPQCRNGSACQRVCSKPSPATPATCPNGNECAAPTCGAGTCAAGGGSCSADGMCTAPAACSTSALACNVTKASCAAVGAQCTAGSSAQYYCPTSSSFGARKNKCHFGGTNPDNQMFNPSSGAAITCTSATSCRTASVNTTNNKCVPTCTTNPAKTCNLAGSNAGVVCPANSCVGRKCSNDNTKVCTSDAYCETNSPNTCSATATFCDAVATGSSTCGYWCGDSMTATACNAPESFCPNTAGPGILTCTKECRDANGVASSCWNTKHCGTANCSGAVFTGSSRMATAKHVITNLISATGSLVNYGFMSFNQADYNPYWRLVSGTVSTSTETTYKEKDTLEDWGCYSRNNGPSSPCVHDGTTYTLLGPNDSKYRRESHDDHHGGGDREQIDHAWCGRNCEINGRTYEYRGSYYSYPQTSQSSAGSVMTIQSDYRGAQYTCLNTTDPGCAQGTGLYSHYNFPWNYANTNESCTDTTGSPAKANMATAPVCGELSSSQSTCNVQNHTSAKLRVGINYLTEDDPAARAAVVAEFNRWLAPQNEGGLVAIGGTPSGCSLQYATTGSAAAMSSTLPGTYGTTMRDTTTPGNAGTPHILNPIGNNWDAYSYMSNVKASDPLSNGAAACRKNFVIFITDGFPNGPGDDATCNTSACSDPGNLASCTCKMVKAAKALADTGIKTYTVGYGAGLVTSSGGALVLENTAKAGNSCRAGAPNCAFSATSEAELEAALFAAVFDAIQGDYATAPPTTATSTSSTVLGNLALLASTDFPSYHGHLRAVDIGSSTPTQLWDAGALLTARAPYSRRIYTVNQAGVVVPVVGPAGVNASALVGLGLGASSADATDIVNYLVGFGRPWALGSIFSSTPVTVGASVDLEISGHSAYTQTQQGRPKMVYVGSDDGLLHAFYLDDGPNGEPAGTEAWAFLPPAAFDSLTAIAIGGGEPPGPQDHIWGINASPKINDVCTGSCSAATDWKTVLVFGFGRGAKQFYALDISASPTADPPLAIQWRTDATPLQSMYMGKLGSTFSTPAFSFTPDGAGNRLSVISFGSGYGAQFTTEGQWVFHVNALTGLPITSPFYAAGVSTPSPVPPGWTDFSMVTDSAVAMGDNTMSIAGYMADPAGRIWRFGQTKTNPSSPMYDAGRANPFLYSPAVRRLSGSNSQVMLVAVTSSYDDDKLNDSADPSGSVVMMIDNGGVPTNVMSIPFTSICKQPCSGANNCRVGSCNAYFGNRARPNASPILLKNLDPLASSSTQVLLSIYEPSSVSQCVLGSSSLVVLDVHLSGGATLAGGVGGAGAGAVTGSPGVVSFSVEQSHAKTISGKSAGFSSSGSGAIISGNSQQGQGAAAALTVISASTVNNVAATNANTQPAAMQSLISY